MPWCLDELGRSDKIDWSLTPGQALPRNLSQPHVVPDRAAWPVQIEQASPASRPVPDYTAGPAIGMVVVSRAFKALVDAMEPVLPIFVPLRITRADGSICADERFLLKLGSFVTDGIVPEKSDVSVQFWKGEVSHYLAKTLSPRLTWRRAAIEGRHLWADRHLPSVNVVSNALYAAMKAQGMTGFLAIEARLDA